MPTPGQSSYILAGTDLIALAELKSRLIRKYGGEDPLGLSRTEYDAASVPPSDIVDALKELPLFASCRVIIVRSAEKLLDVKKFPGLVEDVAGLDAMTLLIMLMSGRAKELMGHPLVDAHLSTGAAAFCYAPRDDPDGERWVLDYCSRHKITITRGAARMIVAMVGLDPLELAPEIDKTAFAVDLTINEEGVRQYLQPHRESAVFEWTDLVIAGNPRALAMTANATEQGKAAVAAVAALYSRLEDMERVGRGEPLGWMQKNAAENAIGRWPGSRRSEAMKILLDLDLKLKSRPPDQHIARTELAALKLIYSD